MQILFWFSKNFKEGHPGNKVKQWCLNNGINIYFEDFKEELLTDIIRNVLNKIKYISLNILSKIKHISSLSLNGQDMRWDERNKYSSILKH